MARGHAHTHTHRGDDDHDTDPVASRGWRRFIAGVAVAVALATVAGMVLLWPGDVGSAAGRKLGLTRHIYRAEVEQVTERPCQGTTPSEKVRCVHVRYRLTEGPDRGAVKDFELGDAVTTPSFHTGDQIVLSYTPEASPRFRYQYADRERRVPLLILAGVFALAVVLLGRLRGLLALVGLGVSIAVLLAFILPALLEGTSPILVAVVGASAIAYLALYLAHGLRIMTTVALLGTLGALALTIGLAELFTDLARLTGFADEEAILVKVGQSGLDVRGLVLAGMVIGALGALDDMTVTQASAVWELRRANARARKRDISRAAMRIGRDHVASTVNTLALAYAGASLPLFLLFVLSGRSLSAVANSEVVATEIVRTLVGSIGLVAAVPITTFLAVQFAPPHPEGAVTPEAEAGFFAPEDEDLSDPGLNLLLPPEPWEPREPRELPSEPRPGPEPTSEPPIELPERSEAGSEAGTEASEAGPEASDAPPEPALSRSSRQGRARSKPRSIPPPDVESQFWGRRGRRPKSGR